MKLDLNKLESVVPLEGGAFQARCPACAEQGHDTKNRNHLHIFKNGNFGCAVFSRNAAHSRRILALAGLKNRDDYSRHRHTSMQEDPLVSAARLNLSPIVEQYSDPWLTLLLRDAPQPFHEVMANTDPRYFLS